MVRGETCCLTTVVSRVFSQIFQGMMMAYRELEKPQVLKMTRKLAEEFAGRGDAGLLAFEHPFNRQRMNAYKQAMKENRFRGTPWAKCFCKEDGCWWRVNGQAASTAALELFEEGYTVNFHIALEIYEADTLQDVRELWETFDTRYSVSGVAEVNSSD
jgi:hypothetical protein